MLLSITHRTAYRYDAPVAYALQQLRLTPKSRHAQNVLTWDIEVSGGKKELRFEDEHANTVDLISFAAGAVEFTVTCTGVVEVQDTHGVTGRQVGFVPLWLFQRETPLTAAGPELQALMADFSRPAGDVDAMHALSAHILQKLPYSTEQTSSALSSEEAIAGGRGVCQDHAHVFISAARHLGLPARYVSGYLLIDEGPEQSATHAWAEVHLDALGWVGFDISNQQSPDARYVRVATGLDYTQAAPISGMRYGHGTEELRVELNVQEQ